MALKVYFPGDLTAAIRGLLLDAHYYDDGYVWGLAKLAHVLDLAEVWIVRDPDDPKDKGTPRIEWRREQP